MRSRGAFLVRKSGILFKTKHLFCCCQVLRCYVFQCTVLEQAVIESSGGFGKGRRILTAAANQERVKKKHQKPRGLVNVLISRHEEQSICPTVRALCNNMSV